MYTVAETESFKAEIAQLLDLDDRLAFFTYLSQNPLKGDVIQNGKGLRKIRWATSGKGKSGGVRVIYYNMLDDGLIVCLAVYAKNEKENISTKELKYLKNEKQGN
ncbi:DNA-binding protein [Enhydrobacter sp. 8BJ]|nr:type II toxin-antitoxin system RelE/ParE family toxin [Enhydrobacter sp. 8BJ]VXB33378.1 DNA-binding protein [Enhydrobacter sp. 8BJ]